MTGPRPSDPSGKASTNAAVSASDATQPEQEFLAAVERYRSANQRPFPTWSEILEVAQALGYRKAANDVAIPEHRDEQ
jgi:hypothetical protein